MWSQNFQEASVRADEVINYTRSRLDTDIIDSCIDACQGCWEELKQLAENRVSEPESRVSVHEDARRCVEALLDLISGDSKQITELFDESEAPDVPSGQENHAKSFIGALVLKNGFDPNPPSKSDLRESANLPF